MKIPGVDDDHDKRRRDENHILLHVTKARYLCARRPMEKIVKDYDFWNKDVSYADQVKCDGLIAVLGLLEIVPHSWLWSNSFSVVRMWNRMVDRGKM